MNTSKHWKPTTQTRWLHFSSVLTSPSTSSNAKFGFAISSAGDLNLDGFSGGCLLYIKFKVKADAETIDEMRLIHWKYLGIGEGMEV